MLMIGFEMKFSKNAGRSFTDGRNEMHECENCGQVCDCDGDDTFDAGFPVENCECDCEELDNDYPDDDPVSFTDFLLYG